MKIKICGITNLDDAMAAIEAGADMLGFNFYPKSPRCITSEQCAAIIAELPSRVVNVGVFVNLSPKYIFAILDQCGLDLAQLSGDESLTDLVQLNKRAFKALRLPTDSITESETDKRIGMDVVPAMLWEYANVRDGQAPALLVDAAVNGAYGGTGVTANWPIAANLARQIPILLAGGLTPENVAAVVRQVRPWGVDVASGVEADLGKKDPHKVRAFIQDARGAIRREAVPVVLASREDLPEILVLQKLAYHSEAELNNDFSIPPMTQTVEGIMEEFGRRTFLKTTLEGRIVGSVRAHLDGENTCHIGRVIVHPEYQNRGIGAQLVGAIESRFAEAQRYELFTSERSRRNLYLYQKLGYHILRRDRLNEHVNLVYLEKKHEHEDFSVRYQTDRYDPPG